MSTPTFSPEFNMADYFLFDRLREGKGGSVAVRFGEQVYTYDEIAKLSQATSEALIAADARRGERVLIVLPDCPPYVWALFGTLAAGCVVAMGNPDAQLESLEYLVEYTRATVVITVPKVAAHLGSLLTLPTRSSSEKEAQGTTILSNAKEELRRVWIVPHLATGEDVNAEVEEQGVIANAKFEAFSNAIAEASGAKTKRTRKTHRDEPSMWLFTSGSTGEPKANIYWHRDYAFNTEIYAKRTVGYKEGDITVSVPRLFFGYATGTNLFFPFAVGGSVGLFSERPTPESLVRALEMYRPTVVTNVPTMLGKLLDYDEAERAAGRTGLDLSSVRFSMSAGEALPETLLVRWNKRFASDVYDGIGSAEMFHIYASNRPGDIKPGSLGKVVEGYELRILPEEATGSAAAEVPAGEIGVLWVRGDSVSFGYWLDRDKSWRTFHGHWCRTGDLFKIDSEGYLYFAGRSDELLKVSGQWVSPLEVEECLLKHASVASCAVIGGEEEGLTKPKAYVVLRHGVVGSEALSNELREFVKTNLSKHKYPRWVEFVSDLPKNDRGKIDRKALKDAQKQAR